MSDAIGTYIMLVLAAAGGWSFLRMVARAVNRVTGFRARRGWWTSRYLVREARLEFGADCARKVAKAFGHLSETDRIKVQAFTYWWVQEARKNILTIMDVTVCEHGRDHPVLARTPAFLAVAKETSAMIARLNASIDAQQAETENDPEVRAL